MKELKSFRFRLYPTEEQDTILKQHGGTVRFVWNRLVEFIKEYKEKTGKFPTQGKMQEYIVAIKDINDFVKLPHSQPIQIGAQRLSRTIAQAFSKENKVARAKKIAIATAKADKKALAKALDYAFPKFKKKSNNTDSIFYPQNFKIRRSRIFFAKIGWIKFIRSAELVGTPKTVTITQDGDQWYCSISCVVRIKNIDKKPVAQSNIVGIDLGLKDFAVLSDGTVINNPKTLKKYLKKLRRESKKLSNKQRKETGKTSKSGKPIAEYSNNGRKQVNKVNRLHRKIRNIRNDFLHKTSYHIITTYDGIAIEDLDIKAMMKDNSKAMNRNICDASWCELGRMLDYKSQWYSKYFVKIDCYTPSTQRCNSCGNIQHMDLWDREYVCSVCGARQPRDFNACLNVRDDGIKKLLQREVEEKAKVIAIKAKKNTVGTTGINACGDVPVGMSLKQEQNLPSYTAKVV
jgi:putative transposase